MSAQRKNARELDLHCNFYEMLISHEPFWFWEEDTGAKMSKLEWIYLVRCNFSAQTCLYHILVAV